MNHSHKKPNEKQESYRGLLETKYQNTNDLIITETNQDAPSVQTVQIKRISKRKSLRSMKIQKKIEKSELVESKVKKDELAVIQQANTTLKAQQEQEDASDSIVDKTEKFLGKETRLQKYSGNGVVVKIGGTGSVGSIEELKASPKKVGKEKVVKKCRFQLDESQHEADQSIEIEKPRESLFRQSSKKKQILSKTESRRIPSPKKSYTKRNDFSKLSIQVTKQQIKSSKERELSKMERKKKLKCSLNFKKLFFLNANTLFNISNSRKVHSSDLGPLTFDVRASEALENFQKIYFAEFEKITKNENNPNRLYNALYKYQKVNFFGAIVLRIVSDIIMVTIPLFIRAYSRNLKKDDLAVGVCIRYLILIALMLFFQNLSRQHSENFICNAKSRIDQALRAFLFENLSDADYKFLEISDPSFLSRLLFFEFQYISEFIHVVPGIISSPVVILISGVIVIVYMKSLSIWVMTLATLTQIGLFLALLNYLNDRVMQGRNSYSVTESKIAIKLQELVANVDVVKVNCLEDSFKKTLLDFRLEANESLKQVHLSYGFIESVLILTPYFFSCMVVGIISLSDGNLVVKSADIITMISVMVAVAVPMRAYSDSLRRYKLFKVAYKCTNIFFETMMENSKGPSDVKSSSGVHTGDIVWRNCSFISDHGASIKKIKDTFNNTQFKPRSKASKKRKRGGEHNDGQRLTLVRSKKRKMSKLFKVDLAAQGITSFTAKRVVLKKVSFNIKKKEKVCIIGYEDSAKESVFLALLSELTMTSGRMYLKGSIAYLDMDHPKFLRSTIRENIVLSEDFSEVKYFKVLGEVDLNLNKFQGRDFTEIVEGQRNISPMDQKRILMARLLYQDTDIVLINKYFDQLSKDLQQPYFEKIVRKAFAQKTVIYTSNVNLLTKLCDKLIVFKQGEAIEMGTYDQLISKRDSHMYEVIMSDNTGSSNFFGKILEGLRIYPKEVKISGFSAFRRLDAIKKMTLLTGRFNKGSERRLQRQSGRNMVKKLKKWVISVQEKLKGKIITQESQETLKNSSASVKSILGAQGMRKLALVLISFVITDLCLVGLQLWMALWANNFFKQTDGGNFSIFLILFAVVSLVVVARESIYTNILLTNLTKIYNRSVNRLLNTRKGYFDENPSSRIVYLLTKDQMIVDNELIRSIFILYDSFMIILLIILVLNYLFLGVFLIFTIFLAVIVHGLYKRFNCVAQRLMAFSNKSRAEMIDVFLEMFDNMTMLRAHGKDLYYRSLFYELTDKMQLSTSKLGNDSMRWLEFRIAIFSVITLVIVLSFPLLTKVYLTGYYLNEPWQLSFAANTGPFLLASIVNFSKFLPKSTLDLISAQRIFHYIMDLAVKEKDVQKKRDDRFFEDNVPSPIKKLIESKIGMVAEYKNDKKAKDKKDEDGEEEDSENKLAVKIRGSMAGSYREVGSPLKFIEMSKRRRSVFRGGGRTSIALGLGGFRLEPKSLKLKKTSEVDKTIARNPLYPYVFKFQRNLEIRAASKFLKSKDKNKFMDKTKPLIKLEGVNLTNGKYSILKEINMKIYSAERVAIVAGDNDSGRFDLLNILLLNEEIDKGDLNSEDQGSYEYLGQNVEFSKPEELRKTFGYLSEYPRMFYGTVRNNLDPDDRYDDEILIKTLHFLKIFEALQYFTGYKGADEITVRLKQIEGLLSVKEIDIDEILSNLDSLRMPGSNPNESGLDKLNNLHNQLVNQSSPQNNKEEESSNHFQNSLSRELELKRAKLKEGNDTSLDLEHELSQNPIEDSELSEPSTPVKNRFVSPYMTNKRSIKPGLFKKKVGGAVFTNRNSEDENMKKITFSIAQSGIFNQISDDAEEFFREQIDNELDKAERAKRIDERLQEFDTDYKKHRVLFKDEYKVIKEFLQMQVGQNGKHLNQSIKKICQLAGIFIHNPLVVFMNEDALSIPGFDPKFFIEQLFKVRKDSAVISICKNYRQLYHYSRVYVMKKGKIEEEGHPLSLVDNKKSKLYNILVKDDIRTVRQLENKLEKNIRKFEEDQDANVKYIQELMKEEIEREEAEARARLEAEEKARIEAEEKEEAAKKAENAEQTEDDNKTKSDDLDVILVEDLDEVEVEAKDEEKDQKKSDEKHKEFKKRAGILKKSSSGGAYSDDSMIRLRVSSVKSVAFKDPPKQSDVEADFRITVNPAKEGSGDEKTYVI